MLSVNHEIKNPIVVSNDWQTLRNKRGKSSVSQTGASDHIYMYVALEKY